MAEEDKYLEERLRLKGCIERLKELGEALRWDEDEIISDIEDCLANAGFKKSTITDN